MLEASVEATEQYDRRANLHIQRRALPSTGAPDRSHTSENNDRMVQIGKQNYATQSIDARGQLKTFNKTNERASTTRLHQRIPHQAAIVDGLRKLRASKKIADC